MVGKRVKANLAFLFTALASLAMLGGSVVPHHHHGTSVCVDISHCQSHGATLPGGDRHEGHAGCHGASHTDTEAHCTLNVNYYCSSRGNEKIVALPAKPDEGHDRFRVFDFFLFSETTMLGEILPGASERLAPSAPVSFHPGFYARISALRAPPFSGIALVA